MKKDLTLAQAIIQTLLYSGDAVSYKEIARYLKFTLEDIVQALPEVIELLENLGLHLVRTETHISVGLHADMSKLITEKKIEDLQSDLSESTLQTLSVILYKDTITKAEIDFIRGVDSGRSLKTLLTRGIIEKVEVKSKKYYIPTTETLAYLGVEASDELTERESINKQLQKLISGDSEEAV
jgi:segregation and condensation protein B